MNNKGSKASRAATLAVSVSSALAINLALMGCARFDVRDDLDGLAGQQVGDALAQLEGGSGPERFAMVSPRLYRGGAPTPDHLALLRALGVTRIVDLRREGIGARRFERSVARRLGMELVEYPFYGVFGADPSFLDGVLRELAIDDGGAVYVHCNDGRDRTGLVVALHRVTAQGWSAEEAWEREVLAYGHRPSVFVREIALTFQDAVLDHQHRARAAQDGAARRAAVSAARDPERGRLATASSREAPSMPAVTRRSNDAGRR